MKLTPSRAVFDHSGRALPPPADEEGRLAVEAVRALDALVEMGDQQEQDETFAALVEAFDRDRLSDRRRLAE